MRLIPIELKPNQSSCIETLSKQEYERTLHLILKKRPVDEALGEKLEALRLFLESTDFGHLRSQYEGFLADGKEVTFLIYPAEGKVTYKLIIE
jgi:hypothetical protein